MDVADLNKFGKKLKIKINDEILAINGKELTLDNLEDVIIDYQTNTEDGEKVEILVERKVKDKIIPVLLKAKAIQTEATQDYYIAINPNATQQQVQLRKTWLGQ